MAKDKPVKKKSTTAQLEAQIVLLQAEVDELTDDLKRAQAEFMNYRRRVESSRGELLDLAKQDIILQVLPLLDNLGRGLGHLPPELKDDPWAQGVEQIARQADEVLKSLGVERIEAVGAPFDPHLHEAVAHTGGGDTVVEELQPGYRIGDKVIRPAIVRVGDAEV